MLRSVLLLLVLAPLGGYADVHDAVFGRWAGESSILDIGVAGESLHARVIALKDPLYLADEEFGPVGAVRRDDLNPDESLQNRPILGLDLLVEYRFDKGKWQGRLYDPGSGNTYSSTMRVDGKGRLQMRGYIGLPMFGRNATFQPVSTCGETTRQMIALAQLSITCD